MAVNTSHKIIQRMVRSINTTPRQWRRSRGRTSSNQNKCRPKAASLVPPNVKMDVSNRRTVPGNVRSNQESIQLRPLTFYGAVRSNSNLASANYDCVVIGAGVRLPPQGLEVFEAVVLRICS